MIIMRNDEICMPLTRLSLNVIKHMLMNRASTGRSKEPTQTWKWRMMVQMRPSVSLGFPSVMSSFLMLTSLTWRQVRKKNVKKYPACKDFEDREEETTKYLSLF